MTVGQALRAGARILNRNRRMCLVFYAASAVPAVLIAAAAMSVAYASLGHSLWAEQMAGNLEAQWLFELLSGNGLARSVPVIPVVAGVLAVAGLVHVFLLGGAMELIVTGKRFSMQSFFGGCGRLFARLLRLAMAALALCALALLVGKLLGLIGEAIWGNGSEAAPLMYWHLFQASAVLFLLLAIKLLFDFSAIEMAAHDRGSALYAMWDSAALIAGYPVRTAGVAAAVWTIAVLLATSYYGFSLWLPQNSLFAVAALLLVRQAVALGKAAVALLFYAAEFAMYESVVEVGQAVSLPVDSLP